MLLAGVEAQNASNVNSEKRPVPPYQGRSKVSPLIPSNRQLALYFVHDTAEFSGRSQPTQHFRAGMSPPSNPSQTRRSASSSGKGGQGGKRGPNRSNGSPKARDKRGKELSRSPFKNPSSSCFTSVCVGVGEGEGEAVLGCGRHGGHHGS